MQRNHNWQGWVAIILAGIALMVALDGRSPRSNQQSSGMMWSAGPMGAQQGFPGFGNAPPAAQVDPQAAQAQPSGRAQRDQRNQGTWKTPKPMMDQSMMGQGMMGRQGHRGMFGIIGMFFGLAKLIAFGLLAWLLLRTFMQHRHAPTATPPTTPAGHDPTIE